jgi:hypothetical protein
MRNQLMRGAVRGSKQAVFSAVHLENGPVVHRQAATLVTHTD